MAPRTIAIQPLPNAMITDPQRLTVTQPWRLYFQSITDAISALTFDPSGVPFISGAVFGPATATPNAIVLFDGATGKLIKDSGVLLTSIQFKPITLADLPTGAAGTVLAGGSPPFYTANPVVTTITVPTVIGGTGTTSSLTLKSTSGVGTTGADIVFQVGNNGATEAIRVITSGFVGIGTNAPAGKLHVLGNSAATASLFFESTRVGVAGPSMFFRHNRGGAIISNGDTIGQISFQGFDGSAHQPGAAIYSVVDGVPGANDMPGALVFATTPDGAAATIDRVIINNAGLMQFGGATSAFPALKRAGAVLALRLADDSADAILTAATLSAGTNTTEVATTAFVNTAITTATIAQAQVTNLISDLAAKAPLASPTFTGTPAAPTAATTTSTTQLATTAFVQNAGIRPNVTLTDGATVAIDVSGRASYYRLVANGDRTLSAPTGGTDGQQILIGHFANGAGRTLTLAAGYAFGSTITGLTATAINKWDYITAVFVGGSIWNVIGYVKGYT